MTNEKLPSLKRQRSERKNMNEKMTDYDKKLVGSANDESISQIRSFKQVWAAMFVLLIIIKLKF